jgi:hypothetical protein
MRFCISTTWALVGTWTTSRETEHLVSKLLSGLLAAVALVSILMVPGGPGLDAQARTTSGTSFTLGVLRRDGVVVPFASYDTRRFVNRWPVPGRRQDIPISIASSPKKWWLRDSPVSAWTAWPMRGENRVVHVKSPVNLTAECQTHIGLQTDYSSIEPPVPPKMQPYPKDGLATTGDVLVGPVEILDAQSADWSKVSADVAAKITAAETPRVMETDLPESFTERQRAETVFTLEILFRSPGPRPGTTVLYFEGVKRYPRFRLAPELLTYAVGFVRTDSQAPPKIEVTAALSDRDRKGLVYTMVLGSFRLDGKLYWVAQRSAWGYERYDILEITDTEVRTVFKTEGGSCG